MCGIVGVLHLDGKPVDPESLSGMMAAQRHRGPDDQAARLFSLKLGRSVDSSANLSEDRRNFDCAVGFNRLSVLDLSVRGRQPMTGGDDKVFIVFNGEIYNAFDYRDELEAAGYTFRSRTDTEVILYLYMRYGLEETLHRLNGMFALCIVDLNRRALFLARDRLGIKPLYIYRTDNLFAFASEIKSFLFLDGFSASIEEKNLDEFFMFRYCAGDRTILKNVSQLEPGHWLRKDSTGEESGRYWKIPDGAVDRELKFSDAIGRLEEGVKKSVGLRLLSDVKVGCQLSGGVDSSLVAAVAAGLSPGEIDGISIIFDDPRFNEEKWMDAVAAKEPISLHKFLLSPEVFLSHFLTAVWHNDLPLNHPNTIGVLEIARRAKDLVTVLLSGEGADELFGGYAHHPAALHLGWIRRFPRLLKFLPFPAAENILAMINSGRTAVEDLFMVSTAYALSTDLAKIRPDFDPDRAIGERRRVFSDSTGDFVGRCLKYDMRTYLVDLLMRQDKMCMAHSVENRVPFLDHNLVTFVRDVPRNFLVRPWARSMERTRKVLLKGLSEQYFGSAFTYRRKQGFPMPLARFFDHPPLAQFVEDAILPGIRTRGVMDFETVMRLWESRKAGRRRGLLDTLWICISFEAWAQRFLDAPTK